MELVIFVRQNLNWENMTPEDFYSQDSTSTVWTILNSDIKLLEFWNDLFLVPYLKFRAKITAIAKAQNSNTGCRILYGKKEIMEELEKKEDFYIAPVDDDDFFHPNISSITKLDRKGLIVWPENWLWGKSVFKARLANKIVGTNCYAIRKSFLLEKIPPDKTWNVLRYHPAIYNNMPGVNGDNKKFLEKITWIEKNFSVSNRHLGTITLLQNTIKNHKNHSSRKRIILKRLEELTGPLQSAKEYEWCKKAVQENIEIHRCLRPMLRLYL